VKKDGDERIGTERREDGKGKGGRDEENWRRIKMRRQVQRGRVKGRRGTVGKR